MIRDYAKNAFAKILKEGLIIPTVYPSVNHNRLNEYKVWYNGNESELALFYKRRHDFNDIVTGNLFWSRVTSANELITHSGLPHNISNTMAKLLFHNGIEVKTEQDQELLDSILLDNQFNALLNEGGITESWAGSFAYKLSFDAAVSDYTIIDLAMPGTFDTVKRRNRIFEIRFNEIFEHNRQKYKKVEVYGFGYIKHEIYVVDSKGERLSTWGAAGLQAPEDFIYDSNIMLAMVKTNKNLKGESDFSTSITEFHAMDEAKSGMGQDLRNGHGVMLIPEIRQVKSVITGQPINYSSLTTNKVVTLATDRTEGADNAVTVEQNEIRTESFSAAGDQYLTSILSNVGLNKITLGLDSTVGANASAEARLQLESTSLRTRKEKIQLWRPFLEEFLSTILASDSIFKRTAVNVQKVEVEFNPYLVMPSKEYTVEEVQKLLELKLIDENKAKVLLKLED